MPVKRRLGKARHLDEDQIEQLLGGPDALLLAGAGYLWPLRAATFDGLGPEEQAGILAQMREDWATYGPDLMERWRSGEFDTSATP